MADALSDPDAFKPGLWASSIDELLTPLDALRAIAREAEHCSFAAAALPADEQGMVFCGQQFQRIQALARKFAPRSGIPA